MARYLLTGVPDNERTLRTAEDAFVAGRELREQLLRLCGPLPQSATLGVRTKAAGRRWVPLLEYIYDQLSPPHLEYLRLLSHCWPTSWDDAARAALRQAGVIRR